MSRKNEKIFSSRFTFLFKFFAAKGLTEIWILVNSPQLTVDGLQKNVAISQQSTVLLLTPKGEFLLCL